MWCVPPAAILFREHPADHLSRRPQEPDGQSAFIRDVSRGVRRQPVLSKQDGTFRLARRAQVGATICALGPGQHLSLFLPLQSYLLQSVAALPADSPARRLQAKGDAQPQEPEDDL